VASSRLLIKASAAKELEAIPSRDRRRLVARIQKLADEPRPEGSEKLSGHDLHRSRQDVSRVLYTIADRELIVLVIKVGHRREVYR